MNWTDWIPETANLVAVLRNLVVVLILGQVLSWHYVRYAQVLSNKRRFGRIFVFIATTTLLMITVVKSSLALSLGLVGALSIIRFRTPIKEPEELAYLFLAIAVGVGLGADETLPTVVVFAVILTFLALRARVGRGEPPLRTVLQVTVPPGTESEDSAVVLQRALTPVEAACSRVDLRRVDADAGTLHLSLVVEFADRRGLTELLAGVQTALPAASVSIIERDSLD